MKLSKAEAQRQLETISVFFGESWFAQQEGEVSEAVFDKIEKEYKLAKRMIRNAKPKKLWLILSAFISMVADEIAQLGVAKSFGDKMTPEQEGLIVAYKKRTGDTVKVQDLFSDWMSDNYHAREYKDERMTLPAYLRQQEQWNKEAEERVSRGRKGGGKKNRRKGGKSKK